MGVMQAGSKIRVFSSGDADSCQVTFHDAETYSTGPVKASRQVFLGLGSGSADHGSRIVQAGVSTQNSDNIHSPTGHAGRAVRFILHALTKPVAITKNAGFLQLPTSLAEGLLALLKV
jgi:hypothetical protein